jgi:ATP-dependent DNA helicase DinG
MPDIDNYIAPEAARYMRRAIAEAGGNEVFFLASCGDDRRVIKAQVIARGDDSCVPALAQGAAVGDVVIHNHPSGLLTPSRPDIDIAGMLGSRGVGFFIINNPVDEVYAVVEPFARESLKPIDIDAVEAALEGGGALSKAMTGHEARAGQVMMAREVARAFNEDRVAALEGGTGVGKSMAYLVPALHWITKNRERVVVSTNTINLQEQLIGKDIPLLGRIGLDPFKAVLVKGRGNYLCLRKLDMALHEGDFLLEETEKEDLDAISEWALMTKEGSRSDLSFMPSGSLWEKLNSETDSCTRLKCRHFSHCFFFRARREAASADLLVVNHHILLADIAMRSEGANDTAILPGYSRLIIDEGHNLEDGATSYFGGRITRLGLLKTLGRLHHKKDRERGTLPLIASRLTGKAGSCKEKGEAWRMLIRDRIVAEKESVSLRVNEAFDELFYFISRESESPGGEVKIRLTDETRHTTGWESVEAGFSRLSTELANLTRSLNSLVRELKDENLGDKVDEPLIELKSLSERLEVANTELDSLLRGKDDGLVRWAEAQARKAGRVIALCGSPLNVAAEIKSRIYDRLKTVVITSATLTVKKKFNFLNRRVGLDLIPGDRLIEGVYPSPFDYRNQVIICIPRDIPEPGSKEFSAALSALVRESLDISRGRAFVLFTSFRMLDSAYRELEPFMLSAGIKGLRQGDSPRHRLLEDFRIHPSAALFGTDSFWEGVDVTGEALSNVIITKLPFSVPDEPVIQARQEEIEARGGNPFMEYIVPQAVIKFRQGFGRLIRSNTDRGSIMVFDRRIVEKNYGREFLESLPEGRLVAGPSALVFEKAREFFGVPVARA